jgi:lipopolysaccharide export system permease protein
MKLFYKYIAVKFWGPFLFAVGVFAVLVFLADLFDHLKYFVNSDASFGIIIKYFLLIVPFWVLVTVPVACLLAGLFVLSDMVNHGEWTAGLASGYSKYQIYIPIIFCICVVSGANFIMQETLSPVIHKKAEMIYEVKIRGKKNFQKNIRKNIVVKISDNSFLTTNVLDLTDKSMQRVILYQYRQGKIASQIDAQTALWNEKSKMWVFENAVIRKFDKKTSLKEKILKNWLSGLDIAPEDLIIEKIWPEDLTIRDILKRIKALKKTELPADREITYLHAKLAFPFASVLMCILAFPFAVTLKKGGKMVHFGLAILVAFFFWWIISVFQSAGEAGMLAPLVAGWAPVAIFSAVAFASAKLTER